MKSGSASWLIEKLSEQDNLNSKLSVEIENCLKPHPSVQVPFKKIKEKKRKEAKPVKICLKISATSCRRLSLFVKSLKPRKEPQALFRITLGRILRHPKEKEQFMISVLLHFQSSNPRSFGRIRQGQVELPDPHGLAETVQGESLVFSKFIFSFNCVWEGKKGFPVRLE